MRPEKLLFNGTLVTISETETIEEAFRRLNANMLGNPVCSRWRRPDGGSVTDGDIRRQLLIKDDPRPLAGFMNRDFVRAAVGTPREQILKLLDGRVQAVPVLDDAGKLVGICTREEFHLRTKARLSRAPAPRRASVSAVAAPTSRISSSSRAAW